MATRTAQISSLIFALLLLALIPAIPRANQQESPTVMLLEVDGAIGPGVGDYLARAIEDAHQAAPPPELILITIDTPGGLVTSLRAINLAILASDIPVACFVYPPGSRAASAGTYMLYACHIAAMAPATTLGAATPVQIGAPAPGPGPGGGEEDQKNASQPPAMEKKILNDSIAYIRSLAQLRGRNAEWAELAVREAATLTAAEALEENVIDLMAETPAELVAALHGREVGVDSRSVILDTANATIIDEGPDWRNEFITTITDPNIAYILLMLGLYGLVLEFYSPGIGVAGVIGGISLLLALFAFHLLPVNFAGAALMLLGIGMLVAEAMMPSFGIIGIGGVVAFVIGSIFLLDTDVQPFRIALPLIAAVAAVSVLFLSVVMGLIWRGRRRPVVSGEAAIIGAEVSAMEAFEGEGHVLMEGENWQAWSDDPLGKGQLAVVTAIEGLLLRVRAKEIKDTDRTDRKETENGNDLR
jgi:membrane-bound serine protease (ClpP class)